MNTCVICHTAYDPFCDEEGKVLILYETGICYQCQKKIEQDEIEITPELEELLEHIERVEEK